MTNFINKKNCAFANDCCVAQPMTINHFDFLINDTRTDRRLCDFNNYNIMTVERQLLSIIIMEKKFLMCD